MTAVPRFGSFPEAAKASEGLLKVANQAATEACSYAIEAAHALPSQGKGGRAIGEREMAIADAKDREHAELRRAERLHADRRAAAATHFLTPDAAKVATGGRGDASAGHAKAWLFHGLTPADHAKVEAALAEWEPAGGARQ